MSPITPRTPPGTMELLPRRQVAFQRMLDTIRRGYERFGFMPVETPVFELSDVLLTKSGGETEKQVYFVQSTGAMQQGHKPEMALRFDLTVPLARYVAEHERDLAFPFRRYQIQRVYRGFVGRRRLQQTKQRIRRERTLNETVHAVRYTSMRRRTALYKCDEDWGRRGTQGRGVNKR